MIIYLKYCYFINMEKMFPSVAYKQQDSVDDLCKAFAKLSLNESAGEGGIYWSSVGVLNGYSTFGNWNFTNYNPNKYKCVTYTIRPKNRKLKLENYLRDCDGEANRFRLI